MIPQYIGWESFEAMVSDFAIGWNDDEKLRAALSLPEWQGFEVLLAVYETGSYDGEASVLIRRGGQLFEIKGSHCSCYGLEGQWDEIPTSIAALELRLSKDIESWEYPSTYIQNLPAIVAALKAEVN